MDQGDRNARQDNQQGGQNKPRRVEHFEKEKSREEPKGRDEAPKRRPGGKKSPWLGGG